MTREKPAVAVYGGANIDIVARSRLQWRPGDSNPGTLSRSAGGVGRNIAENLARLGLPVELVTVFGTDDAASFLREVCAVTGIEVGRSLILPGQETSAYLCILDNDGSLVGAVAAMDSMELFLPAELATRFGPGDDAELVVIDANLPAATIALAVERWKGKPLMLDPVSVAKAAKAAPVVGGFSMVKPNRHEAQVLLGLKVDTRTVENDMVLAARNSALQLLGKGLKEVYVSLGAQGILWADPQGVGLVRPPELPVVNVSGAGDAATAALAWATVRHMETATKASFAVAAASLCASVSDSVAQRIDMELLSTIVRGVKNERLS